MDERPCDVYQKAGAGDGRSLCIRLSSASDRMELSKHHQSVGSQIAAAASSLRCCLLCKCLHSRCLKKIPTSMIAQRRLSQPRRMRLQGRSPGQERDDDVRCLCGSSSNSVLSVAFRTLPVDLSQSPESVRDEKAYVQGLWIRGV